MFANSSIDPTRLVAVVVDTAHELAGDCLATGDIGGVGWAVIQAWAADSDRGHDEPWVDFVKVEGFAVTATSSALVHRLKVARNDEVLEILAPTTCREVAKLLRD